MSLFSQPIYSVSFQTCMIFILPLSTKGDVLKNVHASLFQYNSHK